MGSIKDLLAKLNLTLRHLLREREVIIRSEGRIKYLPLSYHRQLLMVSLLSAIVLLPLLWAIFMTFSNNQKASIIAENQAALAEGKLAYHDLAKEMDSHRQALNDILIKDISQVKSEEVDALAAINQTMDAFITRLEMDIDGDEELANVIIRSRNHIFNELSDLQQELDNERETRQELLTAFLDLSSFVNDNPIDEDAFANPNEQELDGYMVRVEDDMKLLKDLISGQDELLSQYQSFLDDSLTMREALIKKTTHSPEQYLALVGYSPAIGGLGLDTDTDMDSHLDIDLTPSPQFQDLMENQQISAIKLAKLKSYDKLLSCLPLYAPVDYYHKSSSFGNRKNPVTGRTELHAGIDLAGWPGIAIHAAAGGTVIKALKHPVYGNMVEIDHGCNIHTRYGHMKKLNVKKGETVFYRSQIGTLGNTGRSTGPHLHFEVIVNGNHIDPQPFIEAGRYVFKTQAIKDKQSAENEYDGDFPDNVPIPPSINATGG